VCCLRILPRRRGRGGLAGSDRPSIVCDWNQCFRGGGGEHSTGIRLGDAFSATSVTGWDSSHWKGRAAHSIVASRAHGPVRDRPDWADIVAFGPRTLNDGWTERDMPNRAASMRCSCRDGSLLAMAKSFPAWSAGASCGAETGIAAPQPQRPRHSRMVTGTLKGERVVSGWGRQPMRTEVAKVLR
jgi:hypothetical protein